ncbi:hypothetical protein CO251_08040 [Sulfobacillus sp. hq2]|uniref:Stage III sporulation protein AB n=2 Tax=Clostridiales Family XVII. Incertae Sedis TaxID=539000 RepID=A0ABM6RQ53_9FIRM|nr:hypothetical protein BXT84_05790 [Sulfobacillus thermotolerans]POB10758.1 hypothetical protein CO251_08040 [Sulfobacillus sp. hq2]
MAIGLMKLFGAVLTVLSAWYLGHLMAKPYRLRITALEQGIGILGQLRPEIGWHHRILATAFERASRPFPAWQSMAHSLAERIGEHDTDFASAFRQALQCVPGLWEQDLVVWNELGHVLGQSAAEFQLNHLQAAEMELTRLLHEARSQGLKTARLTETLVSLAGLALVIVLI